MPRQVGAISVLLVAASSSPPNGGGLCAHLRLRGVGGVAAALKVVREAGPHCHILCACAAGAVVICCSVVSTTIVAFGL